MEIIFKQNPNTYKQKFKKFLIYDLLTDKYFFILIVLYIFLLITYFLNRMDVIKFASLIIDIGVQALGVGIAGMILYTIVDVGLRMHKMHKNLKYINQEKIMIRINNDHVTVNNYDKIAWDSVKKIVTLKNELYFIFVKKNAPMLTLSREEVIEGDFDEVCGFVKAKLKHS